MTTTAFALGLMAPLPSSHPQAPASPVVPLSAARPAESTLADLLRTSPGLFWLLVGVFSLVMTLGITWVAVSWRRYVKRGGLPKDERPEGATRTGQGRRRWFCGRKFVGGEGGRLREGNLPRKQISEPYDVGDEKVDLGPFVPGWTPPIRTSSLAHLSYYSNATFVPPHEHGLPLSCIQEESESDTSGATNGSLRSSGAYEADRSANDDLSLPSIVVDTSVSSTSLSSLAYLSTTSSPLTAFIESLDAFPRVPLTLPNLPSPDYLQVPTAARARSSCRGPPSPTTDPKQCQDPDPARGTTRYIPSVRRDSGHGKENLAATYVGKDSRTTKRALKSESSNLRPSPNPIHRPPLATVIPAPTSDAF
ncbi:hypothetical protein PHLGIDRAFT_267650 [Phlebiopsis gigantea 11061_1 CR5-6]|uniref:Uncharacterized protein n=1 Tax=Phlebiopsis gigantea (strain 11061_1 CR5-6) TaxID=745531 RepID=A0A0C3S4K5_PHLG1|nr:hypothetical protein PHLGIDRAFT_267650 [Phlebiopsis gigantea 11061_1 CR5-6]